MSLRISRDLKSDDPIRVAFSKVKQNCTIHAQTIGMPTRTNLLFAMLAVTNTLPLSASSADLTVETLESAYKYQNDGTGQITVHAKWKALTGAGAREIGQISIPYLSEFEEVRVTSFRTIKKGNPLQGDPSQVFDRAPAASKNAPVFSGAKLKQFVPPNVEAGDEVEYEYTKNVLRSEKPGDFWTLHLQLTGFPVHSESVTLDIPADRKVSFHSNPGVEHTSSRQAGRRIDKWQLKNSEPRAPTDPPEVVFAVSTIPSWSALGEWLASLNKESEQVTPEIRALAQNLTAGKASQKEKVDAIYEYVSGKVRYVSISFGLGRLQPHKAADVLQNAYGDCKDKHALFATLLSAAEIKSKAVLTYPAVGVIAPEVPFPSQFVHEFTYVDTGSAPMLLDTTLELADPGLLMPGVRGRKALLIQNGSSALIDIPARATSPERTSAKVSATILASGKFSGTDTFEATGEAALMLRRVFRNETAEQQQAVLKALSGSELLNAIVKDVVHSDPADLLHPFSLHYGVEEDAFMSSSETSKRITFYLGNSTEIRALTNMKPPHSGILLPYRDLSRNIDLVIDSSLLITSRMPVHLHTKFGSFDSDSSYENGHLRISRSMKTSGVMVEPADWDSFLQFLRAIESEEEQGFTLERHTQTATAPHMSSEMQVHDKQSALYLSRFEPEKAISEAEKELEVNPNDQFARDSWASALLEEQNWPEAAEQAKKATEMNPPNALSWLLLGKAQAKMGKADEARASFNHALQITDNTIAQSDVAYDLADAGLDLDKAWQLASNALTVQSSTICSPDKPAADEECTDRFRRLANVLDTVGWVLVKQRKFQEATPYMISAYAISPRPPVALHLAIIDAALGKTDEALRLYAIVHRIPSFANPDVSNLRKQLAERVGGESSLEIRIAALPRSALSAGLITPAPQNVSGGTFLALVSGDGVVEQVTTSTGAPGDSAQLDSLKKLKLLPISWPEHSLRSARTIEVRSETGGVQAVSYIVRPAIE
jgi:tetratricopeptide (TPR) repeat protein